nr:MAG TPA: ASCH domain protein [Caudoviricetes sp.]
MAIKPILFNTEMVRAILDGRKTCTRRLVKFLPGENSQWTGYIKDGLMLYNGRNEPCIIKAPYQPGDTLYVRETWCGLPVNEAGHMRGHTIYYYKADGELRPKGWRGTWHPSIHMPKEAARIWLKVTDVKVERLQEITEEQACMEGTDPWDEVCYENNGWHPTFSDPDSGGDPNMVNGFHKLWNSTIKKSDLDRYGWDANPYVWVIEFERCEKPEGV